MTEEERARENVENRHDADPTPESQDASPSLDAGSECPRCESRMAAEQSYCTVCGWDAGRSDDPPAEQSSSAAEASAPLTPEVAPDEEAEVYCPRCGAGMQADQRYCTSCGWDAEKPDEAPPKHRVPPQSPRQLGPPSNANRLTALLLAFFVGWLGAHRFYVNRPLSGLAWLITLGFLGIGVIYDLVLIATGEFRDGEERRLLYWQ